MKTKHTPGPWVTTPEPNRKEWGVDAGPWGIATCADAPGEGSAEANARLIAAAPELLEAAHDAIECIEILDNLMDNIKAHGNYSQEATLLFLSHAASCLRNIPPAIAKATGASNG